LPDKRHEMNIKEIKVKKMVRNVRIVLYLKAYFF